MKQKYLDCEFLYNLREIRKKSGLKQYELAILADIQIDKISKYERFIYRASKYTQMRLAKALNVTPEELCCQKEQQY